MCTSHGSKAPQVAAKAKRRLAEAAIERAASAYIAGAEPVSDPLGELLALAGELLALKSYLAGRVGRLEPGEWTAGDDAAPVVRVYERALDRCAKVLTDLTKLGIADRLADSAADVASAIVDTLRLVLTELGLPPEQVARAAGMVPAKLALVAAKMDEGAGRE